MEQTHSPADRHGHPVDYWTGGKPGANKKEKTRLKILLAAIGIGLLLFILCILLAIGKARVSGYIPTLILELDLSPIGKPPVVLGAIKLPEVSSPYPEQLEFPTGNIEKEISFDTPFTPVVNRRVEYKPVYQYKIW